MAYRFHYANRLAAWEAAHPEYGNELKAFTERFLQNPADPNLRREPYLELSTGRPKPNVFHYKVPNVPIPLVIEVENSERVRSTIDGMSNEPEEYVPDDGERYAKVLSPRSPDDVIPEEEWLPED